MPRFPYVEPQAAKGEAKELLDHVQSWVKKLQDSKAVRLPKHFEVPNNWKMWANNPKLGFMVHRITDYYMSASPLNHRIRELMILLLTKRWNCSYYDHHLTMCQGCGVSLEQARAIGEYKTSPLFTDDERLMLQYAEELFSTGTVDDELFHKTRALMGKAEHYDYTCVIGWWMTLVSHINVCQVGLDSWAKVPK